MFLQLIGVNQWMLIQKIEEKTSENALPSEFQLSPEIDVSDHGPLSDFRCITFLALCITK